MRWLLVADEFPWPLHHGTHLRVFNLARALRELGDDIYLCCGQSTNDDQGQWGQIANKIFTAKLNSNTDSKNIYTINANLSGLIASLDIDFDAAVCFHARCLGYGQELVDTFGRKKAIIADLIDDYGLEQKRRLSGDLPNILRLLRRIKYIYEHGTYEKRFLHIFNRYSFVGSDDAESFAHRHQFSESRCSVIQNGVDTEIFKPAVGVRPSAECEKLLAGGPVVVFPGRFVHPPNVQAARFLVEKIAPRIRNIYPDLKIVLLGADPPVSLQHLAGNNVIVTDFVEDLPAWLGCCDIAALCMQSGTGIKNKLLEAWASGLPVVATALACRGAEGAKDGENLLVASDYMEFAAAVVRLISDSALREKLIANGRKLVCGEYSWRSSAKKLQALAQQILM